ncbi:hypothetical protein ACU5AX_18365 [Sphingomonas sp. XXL09]|uniref:hypothetical protein n=1 Tax=Sphingomonas sp. XXL09 TaxID=3457787 RepID=UPI00406BD883
MDIAVDRRRFLIAGAATATAVAVGSAWLWWDSTDATRPPADDAVKVVPGADRSPIVAPSPTAPQSAPSDASDAPDRDTEARLSRLMEDDAAKSQLRMRERQERLSEVPAPTPAPPEDAAPGTWAP